MYKYLFHQNFIQYDQHYMYLVLLIDINKLKEDCED